MAIKVSFRCDYYLPVYFEQSRLPSIKWMALIQAVENFKRQDRDSSKRSEFCHSPPPPPHPEIAFGLKVATTPLAGTDSLSAYSADFGLANSPFSLLYTHDHTPTPTHIGLFFWRILTIHTYDKYSKNYWLKATNIYYLTVSVDQESRCSFAECFCLKVSSRL